MKRTDPSTNSKSGKRVKFVDNEKKQDEGKGAAYEDESEMTQISIDYEDSEKDSFQEEKSESRGMQKMQKKENDDISDDEEEADIKLRKKKISHISAEEAYDDKEEQNANSLNLTKGDLGNGVDGIMRFNLKEDREDGFFDGSGNFIWKKKEDDDLQNDPYLSSLYEKGIYSKQEKNEESGAVKKISESMLFVRLCSYLEEEETVQMAIQRLGKYRQQKSTPAKKSKKHVMAFEKEDILTDEEVTRNKEKLATLIECCEVLIEDYINLYDMKKAELKRLVIMNYQASQRQWEYYWSQPGASSQVYGPFTTAQMIEWHENGCFAMNPMIRQVKQKEVEEKTFSKADFEADFEEDFENEKEGTIKKDEAMQNQWVEAKDVDYFE